MAFDRGEIALQSKVKIRFTDIVPPLELELGEDWEEGQSITLDTTLGRAIFNDTLPADYPFVNYEVGKKAMGAIVNDLAERYTKVEVAASLDALKDTGFHWATRSGVTVSIDDVTTPDDKAEILAEYEAQADQGPEAVRARPGHRRGASPGARRDLDPGLERRGQVDGDSPSTGPTRSS